MYDLDNPNDYFMFNQTRGCLKDDYQIVERHESDRGSRRLESTSESEVEWVPNRDCIQSNTT
jgi:hypothetical protein